MKKYNVIWFDDEFKTLHKIKEKAEINGIKLYDMIMQMMELKN